MRRILFIATFGVAFVLGAVLASCNSTPRQSSPPGPSTEQPQTSTVSVAAVASPTPTPERLLTVCMPDEPASLFLYGDTSQSARAVRQAIYDGPVDIVGYSLSPVILEKIPDTAGGEVALTATEVRPGELLVDANGQLTNLQEGTVYLPAGCQDVSCALISNGNENVQVDQLSVKFKLRPGLQWSDGANLTADDSLFSYETARSLFPQVRADLLARTQVYQALDSYTLEWRGVPGYRPSNYASFFFDPLPRHAWGALPVAELFSSEATSRKPLGWGPFVIESWDVGEKINLTRNPGYFRSPENLPWFDRLVFRFIPDRDQALQALQEGECDVLDESYHFQTREPVIEGLGDGILVTPSDGSAWIQILFGLAPIREDGSAGISILARREIRQALAQCIDRSKIVQELIGEDGQVLESYTPPDHPLYNLQAQPIVFSPSAANSLLDSTGWKDLDGDPATPRVAQGVSDVTDATPLSLEYLAADDPDSQKIAELVKNSLQGCGIEIAIRSLPWQELVAPGPQGPVFGRQFQLAQFAWASAPEPACFLYLTGEIPGPYPQYPKGWGGANAAGYSNPEFDRWCSQALNSLPDDPVYADAHRQAQAIFALDLPALPLFQQRQVILSREAICGLSPDSFGRSSFSNLEALQLDELCRQ